LIYPPQADLVQQLLRVTESLDTVAAQLFGAKL
jgi:hypothetical protein